MSEAAAGSVWMVGEDNDRNVWGAVKVHWMELSKAVALRLLAAAEECRYFAVAALVLQSA